MIFDTSTLPLPMRLEADLCVIGSGAGGAMAAMTAAEAGMKVVILEAGTYITPMDMVQREEVMVPKLLWSAGGSTTVDRSVKIHQGKGVGGSTLHNTNLCKRIPEAILQRWHRERGLEHLPLHLWSALYDEMETLLEVSDIPRSMWNQHNLLLEEGCRQLGWKGGGLRHNRTGCIGSGFCELGCSYDAKNNALKVLIPRAVAAGAQVLTSCHVTRIEYTKGRVSRVDATVMAPNISRALGNVIIEAPRVCLSASATGTPALLRRSGVPSPSGTTGDTLRIHPALVAAGVFDAPVQAWTGVPQSYECTEFLDLDHEEGRRTWILPAIAHPVGVANFLPSHGAAHAAMMSQYPHMAVFAAMIHDLTQGRVRPRGETELTIEYWSNLEDRRELMAGLADCARLLFAAGAKEVIIPMNPVRHLKTMAEIKQLEELELTRGMIDVVAVHPMASVPMGDDPSSAAVDSRGKHHHLEGLWIADGSLFPSSIGIPPQLSIYAMGRHVGRAIVASG